MSFQIHPQARTTPKVRQEIKESQLAATRLAALYNVTVPTIQKWKNRESTEDLPHTAHNLNTTLTPVQEDIVVELRRTLLLPIDDLLVIAKEFVNPAVSRSGLGRCLDRHGVGNLRKLTAELNPEEAKAKKPAKSFKDYEPGYLHVDIKYLPRMPDEAERRYLFAAQTAPRAGCSCTFMAARQKTQAVIS